MTAASVEQTPLELWELLGRCLGKPELAARVLNRFEHQLADDLAKLRTAMLAHEYEQAREFAHRIKGASANVAAHALRDQADLMESAIRVGLYDQARVSVDALELEQQRFIEAVRNVKLGV